MDGSDNQLDDVLDFSFTRFTAPRAGILRRSPLVDAGEDENPVFTVGVRGVVALAPGITRGRSVFLLM